MDEPPEPSRAARRASTTRQRLLSAALTVINSRGFDGCAIEDITELADVGKGTFYRHFDEKQAILASLFDAAVSDLCARIKSQSPAISLETAVKILFAAHTRCYAERRDLFLLFLQAQNMAATRGHAVPALNHALKRYFDELDRTLAPFLPGSNAATLRRLSCAISAVAGGFVTCTLTGLSDPQTVESNLETVSQAFLMGLSRLVGA